MRFSELILVGLAVFGASAWMTSRLCRSDSWFYILDYPNDRSLHTSPTPRTGGIAIVFALLCGGTAISIILPNEWLCLVWLASALLVVAVTSFIDDRIGLAPVIRIVAHLVAAVLLLFGGFSLTSVVPPETVWTLTALAGIVVTLLGIIWSINLYNFMDGMDGFAGGMALFGFGTFAVIGWLAGQDLFASINLIIAMAVAGFLVFNFPPARIFMGDIGSSSLGCLAAAVSLWGAKDHIFPLWVAVLVFSPFIMDATVTLLRRLFRFERIWEAHKTHYYQKLVQAGWGHRKTVVVEYIIMLGCGLTALSSLHADGVIQAAMLIGWALFYIIFFSWISWYASRRSLNSMS